MSNELAIAPQSFDMFMPVMDLALASQRRQYLTKFVSDMLRVDHDFGKIPGAGNKPTLLKPGAEKLATFFGLTPVFVLADHVEDWTGANHNGEPFFYYRYKCELWRQGNLIATSEGSCNSHEVKYRYRKGERVCPQCGNTTIIKGRADFGGGWLCYKAKGGCGAKFSDGDKSIESQEVGRILNPDVADQVNTMQKMAQKRSLIASVLLAVNASEFFTQDIEDMAEFVDVAAIVVEPTQKSNAKAATTHRNTQNAAAAGRCTECNAPDGKPHASSCSHRANGNGGTVTPSTPPVEPPPVTSAEVDAAATQSSEAEGKELMSVFDESPADKALADQAAEIVGAEKIKTPPQAQAWAVKNGYRTNDFSARNAWKTMIDDKFGGVNLTTASMPEVVKTYVELCLLSGKKELQAEAA